MSRAMKPTEPTLQRAVLACRGRFTGTAVICEDRCLSYDEFDRQTDRIASALTARGIGPGRIVALQMARTERMVLAMFGIFKSGAALLPLSPDLPEMRRRDIYDTVPSAFPLTDAAFDGLTDFSEPAASSAPRPLAASSDDPALFFFTSGSTGKPKGVCHSQRSEALNARMYPESLPALGLPCRGFDTVLAKTNISFVSSFIFEYLSALLYGRTLVLLTDGERNDWAAVGRLIESHPNSSLFLTPSELESYLREEGFRKQFRHLAVLVLAGEMVHESTRSLVLAHASPETTLLSLYGSTECHGIAWSNLRSWEQQGGVPCNGVRVDVLDDNGTPLPAGQSGEIAVLSGMVMTGYLGREARRFTREGRSWLGTGDLGKKTDDGRVYVLGRMDRMVKYHGLRIELADIEENLCRCPEIRKAAVVLADTRAGNRVLCAYYESDLPLETAYLRNFLEAFLPVYMIPVGYVRLDRLPRNRNGKIDYPELSGRPYRAQRSGAAFSSGGTEEEKVLLSAVKELLRLEESCSPDQNLLELGLDSLTGYRLISRLRETGYELTMSDLFSHPVPAELSALLRPVSEGQKTAEAGASAEEGIFAVTELQLFWGAGTDSFLRANGLYILDSFLAEIVYTPETLQRRMKAILARHPALRSTVTFEGGKPGQRVMPDAAAKAEWVDLRSLAEPEASPFHMSAAQEAAVRELAVKQAELQQAEETTALHIVCAQISGRASVFLLLTNHFVTDGASLVTLKQELVQRALPSGRDAYLDFLRFIAGERNLAEARAFWKDYLRDAALSVLPRLPAAEENPKPDFRSVTIRLDPGQTERLSARCAAEKVSMLSYVLYAYGMALVSAMDEDALVIQLMSSGRGIPVPGIDSTVGCLIQYIPVVIRRGDTPAAFQQSCLAADRYSYLPTREIWRTARGLEHRPKLAPFLISEVFPPVQAPGYYRERSVRDYEHMMVSNFVVKDEDRLTVYFHFDAARVPEAFFRRVTAETEKLLMDFAG